MKMKKTLITLGAISSITIPVVVVSCAPSQYAIDLQEAAQRTDKAAESFAKALEFVQKNENVNRIEFDFLFMRKFGISNWTLRKNDDGTWNNSFRKVVLDIWRYIDFNVTSWSDEEFSEFVKTCPSDIHKIDPITNVEYSTIISQHMNGTPEFWLEKVNQLFAKVSGKTINSFAEGDKIKLIEVSGDANTLVEEFIL